MATQDFFWRYLAQNRLDFARKYYSENWKDSYKRTGLAEKKNWTKDDFEYLMCPLRDFEQEPIQHVDCHESLIFAVDAACRLKIFLLDE